MTANGTLQLRTIGHACLIVLENGELILATDPWLIVPGSASLGGAARRRRSTSAARRAQ